LPQYRIDPFPDEAEFDQLWRRAWSAPPTRPFAPVLQRSLGHLGAFERDRLIAFVNIAWMAAFTPLFSIFAPILIFNAAASAAS
jgi:hypothetical protein